MQRHIISGTIKIPQHPKQKQLHRKLGEFAEWMKRPKDAGEIRKDQRKSVPVPMLPMLF
nr:hypothetical protein [uncultured Chryseobacterium sp.]